MPGAEKAAYIFEALDAYTRQVIELHHPDKAVRLERAFGAYYEGQRDGFHLGVNEHCDGVRIPLCISLETSDTTLLLLKTLDTTLLPV